jgi:NitT/TauT family transport system permease protein
MGQNPARPPGRSLRSELLGLVLPPLAIFILLVLLWQLEIIHGLLQIQTFQLPVPSQIIEAFDRRRHDLWVGTWYTLSEAILGLGLGATLGFVSAAVFVRVDALRRGLMPLAISANAIPIIAITPIVTRWLGFDRPTRIVIVAVMTFAPMVVSAYKGLVSIDNLSLDLMHSYAATPLQILLKVRLPNSLSYVFSALKVGATASMIGAVVAEFFNSAGGIGKLIANNIQSGDFALAWCGVVIVTLAGLVLYLGISAVERLVVPWDKGLRRP